MASVDSALGIDLLRLTLRSREIDKHFAEKLGLTIDEMHTLNLIYCEKPSCVKKLGEFLTVNATRISKILWSLERIGLVDRTIDVLDHRKEQLSLTEEGREVARKILSLYADMGNKLFGHWPHDMVSDFSRLLQSVTYDD